MVYDNFINIVTLQSKCMGRNSRATWIQVQTWIKGTWFTSYENRSATTTSPTRDFQFFVFVLLSLCLSSSSPVFISFFIFLPYSHPLPSMTHRPGPWQLDRVKARLRQEQVEREQAASARYRQAEPKEKNTSWTDCLLFCLIVRIILLILSVLLLSGVLLSFVKKT